MSTSKKHRYVQRDLEDLIEEVKLQDKKLDSNHLQTNHLKTKSMSDTATQAAPVAKKKVSIQEIIDLLGKGYVRLAKFDKGGGSIQEHYGLSASQVKEIFNHVKLKGKKSKVQTVDIVDDAPNVVPTVVKAKTVKAAKPTAVATDADLFK